MADGVFGPRRGTSAVWCLFAIALCGCVSSPRAIQADRPPNVLFIAVDDLRMDVGVFGDTPALTPNIDALAARGVAFSRAYVQQAVCSPSRSSLMTGRRPDTIKVWDLTAHFRDTLPNVVTLSQHFKDHGYHAQGIGKIYHNLEPSQDPPSWSVPVEYAAARHWVNTVLDPDDLSIKPESRRVTPVFQSPDVDDEAYFDGQIAARAAETLGELKDEPFFLAVGFWRPHLPFSVPKAYWDLYDRDALPPVSVPEPPLNMPAVVQHRWSELRGYADVPRRGPVSPEMTAALRHGYFAAVSYVDAQVGKVMAALDAHGLADNTIIVFWSDHGFHLGEYGMWAKNTNFELNTRVPLIIVPPGGENAGVITDALVETVDLYPTLVELTGLPMPEGLEGVSLKPILEDPDKDVKPAAFSQFQRPFASRMKRVNQIGYSMRTDRFRYTEWLSAQDLSFHARELYDHASDPLETLNRAEDPEFADAVAALSEQLHASGVIGWELRLEDMSHDDP